VLGWRKKVPYLQVFAATDADAEGETDLTRLVQNLLKRTLRSGPPDWATAIRTASERRAIPVPIAPGSESLEDILEQLTEDAQSAR
jgi:hypothetical protein